jgi:hypothetical protein
MTTVGASLFLLFPLLSAVVSSKDATSIHAFRDGGGNLADAQRCSLNGDFTAGACVCDKGWTGARCAVLNLGTVDKNNRPGIANASYATWGASPIEDEDGKWRVAHAQMSHHCGIFQAWMTNSFIGLSVSEAGVGGPYTFEAKIVPEFSHNPQIRKLDDGSYAMFFIGGWPETPCQCESPDDGTKCPAQRNDAPNITDLACQVNNWTKASCPDKMPGPNENCCGPNAVTGSTHRLNSGCGIATSTADTLQGPWSSPKPLIIVDQYTSDNVFCTHSNPSPVFLKNGSVLMAFNAGCCDPGCSENVGTAISDHGIEGPWRLLSRNSIFPSNGVLGHACEDPFLWQSQRGWHMLQHNFGPVAPGESTALSAVRVMGRL